MQSTRRSPRNHKQSEIINFNVKAANIKWTNYPGLTTHLFAAIESNKRWRKGLFARSSISAASARIPKSQYYHEIARAIFSAHPLFLNAYRRKPASFARAVKEKLDSVPHYIMLEQRFDPRRGGKISVMGHKEHPEAWAKHRENITPIPISLDTLSWHPYLPLELQLDIITIAIHLPPSHSTPSTSTTPTPNPFSINLSLASTLSTVNRAWNAHLIPFLYHAVSISEDSQLEILFCRSPSYLAHSHRTTLQPTLPNPTRYTKILRFSYIPCANNTSILPSQLRIPEPIPTIELDMSSFQTIADVLSLLSSSANRVAELIQRVGFLYKLISAAQTTTLRLITSSSPSSSPVSTSSITEDTWRDIVSTQIALLKAMTNVTHLDISAELFLAILPKCIQDWCNSEEWEFILGLLREGDEGDLPPLLGNCRLTKITLRHPHVPMLAFMARMASAPRIEIIELVGWSRPLEEMPEQWVEFVKRERENTEGVLRWLD